MSRSIWDSGLWPVDPGEPRQWSQSPAGGEASSASETGVKDAISRNVSEMLVGVSDTRPRNSGGRCTEPGDRTVPTRPGTGGVPVAAVTAFAAPGTTLPADATVRRVSPAWIPLACMI